MHLLLAYLTAFVHGLLVLSIIIGPFLSLSGYFGQKPFWRRLYWIILLSVVASFAVYKTCFLRLWEIDFRELAGASTYQAGFVSHYLSKIGINISDFVIFWIGVSLIILGVTAEEINFLKKRIRPAILSWAIYDLGNTIFSTLIITLFYPILIVDYLGGAEWQLGLIVGMSMLLAGFLVPYFGAISDLLGKRMPFLIIFTIVASALTFLIGFSGLGLALLLGLLANLFYHASLDLYDTKLTEITPVQTQGRVSGLGIALGYLGTLIALVLSYLILKEFGFETEKGTRAMFTLASSYFLLFALPVFFYLKDDLVRPKTQKLLKEAGGRVYQTWKNFPKTKNLSNFLLASFFYNDGMNTIILFLYLFAAREIQLSLMEFFVVFSVMAVAAGFGALLSGKIADRLGYKLPLQVAVPILGILTLLLFIFPNRLMFGITGMVGGVLWGTLWTVTRPMLSSLAPREKIGELFGYQGLTEKFAGVVGPIIFGTLAAAYGYRPALLSVLVFFLLGFYFLNKVEYKKT